MAMTASRRAPATFSNAEFERLVRSGGLGDKPFGTPAQWLTEAWLKVATSAL
jgi:hypothetical protein